MTVRKTYNYRLDDHLMAYEGLVSMAIGEHAPIALWARVFQVAPEPAEITTPPTHITIERPEVLIHLAPERPDLPLDRQPPTWPPPFPAGSADGAAPYCRISVEAGGRREVIERLRVLDLEPVVPTEKENTWDALLGGTL